MCPDTSAGTLAIAAAPAPHFVRAVQSAQDRTSCQPRFMLAMKTIYVALSRHNLSLPDSASPALRAPRPRAQCDMPCWAIAD